MPSPRTTNRRLPNPGLPNRRLPNRRGFLKQAGALGTAGLLGASSFIGSAVAQEPVAKVDTKVDKAGRRIITEGPGARLVEIGDGLFTVVSTPLNADGRIAFPDTLCNGGIIVTDDAVIAYDAYYTAKGAAWVNEAVHAYTGRWVTHVIVSHLHLDHSGGIAGFQRGAEGPEVIMTQLTWDLILETYGKVRRRDGSPYGRFAGRLVAPTQVIVDESQALPFKVGGRSMTLQPMAGHTPSDLVIVMDDAPVTFASDLAWWGLFPNYVNAIPAALGPSVAALLADQDRLIVTGHGGLAMARDMGPYQDLISSIEVQARAAFEDGLSAAEGAKRFQMPPRAQGWASFSPRYPEVAFAAWYRDLKLEAGWED